MYTIKNMYITKRANTRPGWRQQAPKSIVLHWTANPGGTALNHYNYFNNGAGGNYASAHYFVDKDNIVCIIPDTEVAFHANETGYSRVSYLNGLWTPGINYKGNANSGSIGIEMCLERDGSYHPETLKKTWWLTAHLLKKHGLGLDRIETHNRITGKACPRDFLGTTGRQTIINNVRPYFNGQQTPPKTEEKETNYMKLNDHQKQELAKLFKDARLKGLFSSDQHEKDVLAGKMDRDKAIYLVALIAAGKRF